jgi:hypothetical protein
MLAGMVGRRSLRRTREAAWSIGEGHAAYCDAGYFKAGITEVGVFHHFGNGWEMRSVFSSDFL